MTSWIPAFAGMTAAVKVSDELRKAQYRLY